MHHSKEESRGENKKQWVKYLLPERNVLLLLLLLLFFANLLFPILLLFNPYHPSLLSLSFNLSGDNFLHFLAIFFDLLFSEPFSSHLHFALLPRSLLSHSSLNTQSPLHYRSLPPPLPSLASSLFAPLPSPSLLPFLTFMPPLPFLPTFPIFSSPFPLFFFLVLLLSSSVSLSFLPLCYHPFFVISFLVIVFFHFDLYLCIFVFFLLQYILENFCPISFPSRSTFKDVIWWASVYAGQRWWSGAWGWGKHNIRR